MEKKYETPELTIILFTEEDIITTSGEGQGFGASGDDWSDTPNWG